MSKLLIMRGLPACGKSTAAEEIMKNSGNYTRVNKDLLRTMLHFDKFTQRNEGLTRDAERAIVRQFLKDGKSVIVDDTNLNPGTLQSWQALAMECGAIYEVKDMTDVPIEACVVRDEVRQKRVGAHVIKQMALQHLHYLEGTPVVICDIDGTIADATHRQHFVRGEKKDWKNFFAHMSEDPLRADVLAQVISMAVAHNLARIIFVSARPGNYREETMQWLTRHLANAGVGGAFELLIMRDANDTRPDTIVKDEIYTKYLSKLNIVAVFDDRPSVIRMWRSKGLNVIDVGKGEEF